MTVYVDDMKAPFGRMVMCHMWADGVGFRATSETSDLACLELLAAADAIGVARKWIQGHPTLSTGKGRNASWVHFDISLGKKDLAIRRGAVETDRYGPSEHVARMRGNTVALDRIAFCRALAARDAEAKHIAPTQMDLLSSAGILRDDLAARNGGGS